MNGWAELKDFFDLMLRPSRRIDRRIEREREVELEFQTNIRLQADAAMFRKALDGERDWRFP
jgi:hypothetical protein